MKEQAKRDGERGRKKIRVECSKHIIFICSMFNKFVIRFKWRKQKIKEGIRKEKEEEKERAKDKEEKMREGGKHVKKRKERNGKNEKERNENISQTLCSTGSLQKIRERNRDRKEKAQKRERREKRLEDKE